MLITATPGVDIGPDLVYVHRSVTAPVGKVLEYEPETLSQLLNSVLLFIENSMHSSAVQSKLIDVPKPVHSIDDENP